MKKKEQLPVYRLPMTVLSDDNFLSPYCGDAPVISDEVAGYLNNAVRAVPPLKLANMEIEIKSDVITEEEGVRYEKAIRHYYENERARLLFDLRRTLRSATIMLIIGAFVLAFMIAVSISGVERVIYEILDIVGWVFIWEAVDLYFFERHKLNRELTRFSALAWASVVYVPLTAQNEELNRTSDV